MTSDGRNYSPSDGRDGSPAEGLTPTAVASPDPVATDVAPTEAGPAEARPADAGADTALGEMVWLGRVIDDRYRITRVLGEGGMGAVFVAEHLKLCKHVALKVIRSELAGIGDVAARFAREAMAVARFEHPHVASAVDFGTLPEGGAYLVMQLVQGQSLRSILEAEGRFEWRRMAEIGSQVADALAAAKAEGIVHRDLKPDNIMIERRDDGSELVKILDFGIARITVKGEAAPEGAALTRELTRVGTIVGTPGYMAPEQALGDAVDHRADLYALGVVLWEGITGDALWDAPDLTGIITRQLSETAPSVREHLKQPDIPVELDALITQLLARTSEERPDQPGQVRDELRRLSYATPHARPLSPADVARSGWQGLGSWARAGARGWRQLGVWQRLASVTAGVVLMALLGGWLGASVSGDRSAAAPSGVAKGDRDGRAPSLKKKLGDSFGKLMKVASPELPSEPEIPPVLEEAVQTLFEGRRRVDRRKAAIEVLDHTLATELPAYVTMAARFERARGCKTRSEIMAEMIEANDVRVMPTLRHLDETPPRGCGFLNLADCYACLRAPLAAAMAALEPAANEQTAAEGTQAGAN